MANNVTLQDNLNNSVTFRTVEVAGVHTPARKTLNGDDEALGSTADAAWNGTANTATAIAVLKYTGEKVEAVRTLLAGTLSQNIAQYGGANVGAGNAIHVQPGTAAAFPVTDNGGSLTVDGAVSVSAAANLAATAYLPVRLTNGTAFYEASGGGGGGGNGAVLDGANSSIAATVFDYANSNPLAVRLTDASGDYVGGGDGAIVDGANASRKATVRNYTNSNPLAVVVTNTTGDALSAIPVTDNGGSLTVDGTVAVSGTVTVDTELPTAAALADTAANPTTSLVGACLMGYGTGTFARVRIADTSADLAATNVSTNTTVWTPASGKKPRLMGGSISVNTASSLTFRDSAANGTVLFRTPTLVANVPYNFDVPNGRLCAAANNVVKAVASVNCAVTGTLYGTEE